MTRIKDLLIEAGDLRHENEQLLATVEGFRKEKKELLKRIADLENMLIAKRMNRQ